MNHMNNMNGKKNEKNATKNDSATGLPHGSLKDVNYSRMYKPGGTRQAAYMRQAFSGDMPTSWTPDGYQNLDYICYATYQY